jgi:serine/threonine protein kinase
MLAGQPPFAGRPAMQILAAHMYEPPALLTMHRPDLSVELQAVVLRCLAKNPTDRFPDVAELETALADPAGAGDRVQLGELGTRYQQVQEELAWTLLEWERIQVTDGVEA